MIFYGIDPGLSGGIARIDGPDIILHPMPTIKDPKKKTGKLYDIPSIRLLLDKDPINTLATLEKAIALPGMGVQTPFLTGYCQGIFEALFVALGIQYQIVHPKSWGGSFFKDINKTDTKSASIMVCKRLFPHINLIPENCKKPSDGLSDALLICEYGKRMYAGK